MEGIFVLGMHRSGTSCLTGIMQGFGVELGEVFTSNPFNKRGNREQLRIWELNEAVLDYNGGAWDRPVRVSGWSAELAAERDSILAELKQQDAGFWGFKDPRTLFTLDFWRENQSPLLIGTVRHPVAVARSLNDRNGMPIEDGVALWMAYNERLMALLRQQGFPLVNFDLDPETYLADATAKLVSLGLDPDRGGEAKGFFDQDLRNQHRAGYGDEDLPERVSALYRALVAYSEES